MTGPEEQRPLSQGGRPPERLRAAVVDLLKETNYSNLTIRTIIERAGVDREVLYRWPSKAELATAVYIGYIAKLSDPDTGQVRDDLLGYTYQVLRLMRGPAAGLLHAVLAELYSQHELREAYSTVDTIVIARLRKMLNRGVEQGQVRPDAPIDLVIELARGWWTTRFSAGRPLNDTDAVHLVDNGLMPILAPRPTRA